MTLSWLNSQRWTLGSGFILWELLEKDFVMQKCSEERSHGTEWDQTKPSSAWSDLWSRAGTITQNDHYNQWRTISRSENMELWQSDPSWPHDSAGEVSTPSWSIASKCREPHNPGQLLWCHCINIIRHDICSSPTQNTEGGYLLTGRRSNLPKVPKLIKEKNIFEKVILSEDETSKEEEK